MKVIFYSGVLAYTDGEKFFEAEDCSAMRDLIDKLAGRFGERFREFILGDETCFFLVNGKGIMKTGGLDTPLHPGDKVEVLPFAGAG